MGIFHLLFAQQFQGHEGLRLLAGLGAAGSEPRNLAPAPTLHLIEEGRGWA